MAFGTEPTNVFTGGIDFRLAGNGGPECVDFLTFRRRIAETLVAIAVSYLCIAFSYNQLSIPTQPSINKKDRGGKRVLLVFLCLVFGVELGFKFATQSLIFVLNPCHVTTVLQVSHFLIWIGLLCLHFGSCDNVLQCLATDLFVISTS